MEFIVHGPFEFSPEGWPKNRIYTKARAKTFCEKNIQTLQMAGCYVFCIRAGRGYTPWYVGKTKNHFSQETFTNDKLQKYNEAVSNIKQGTGVLFFLEASGQGQSREKQIKELELFLIQTAAYKNPKLVNVHGKRGPKWNIRGILRTYQGAATKSSRVFKRALF